MEREKTMTYPFEIRTRKMERTTWSFFVREKEQETGKNPLR